MPRAIWYIITMYMVANIRLQKYIADCGVASRRKAEEMIRAGVNLFISARRRSTISWFDRLCYNL